MKNLLVIYDGLSMYTPTVRDYIEAFSRYSSHNVHYLHVAYNTKINFDINAYDAILITYSCRLCFRACWSEESWNSIANFRGLKAVFIQDEYQRTDLVRQGIKELGIRLVFTCVPEDKINWVYPKKMFPDTRFVRVLTGYVTQRLKSLSIQPLTPLNKRPIWIGYRGRPLGYCFGDLAYYKTEIGRRVKIASLQENIPVDIEWTEEARIYQEKWYSYIASCRTMLGVPSGSNIFDWDDSINQDYRLAIEENPNLTYEEYRPRIAAKEKEINMGQISPRMFECIALGTCLILLEGSYSNILKPDIDYIPLKRDFSNLNNVLDKIRDISYLEEMVTTARKRIIQSGKWSYEKFIKKVDSEIDALLKESQTTHTISYPLKAYDQDFLEQYTLNFGGQFPLSRALDISASRETDEGFEKMISLESFLSLITTRESQKEVSESVEMSIEKEKLVSTEISVEGQSVVDESVEGKNAIAQIITITTPVTPTDSLNEKSKKIHFLKNILFLPLRRLKKMVS